MTVGRHSFGLSVFRDQLWAMGEGESLNSCEYLDRATNTWMAGPAFASPPPRYFHCLVVLNGQLWAMAFGGVEGSQCLDVSTNTWVKTGPVLPATFANHATLVVL